MLSSSCLFVLSALEQPARRINGDRIAVIAARVSTVPSAIRSMDCVPAHEAGTANTATCPARKAHTAWTASRNASVVTKPFAIIYREPARALRAGMDRCKLHCSFRIIICYYAQTPLMDVFTNLGHWLVGRLIRDNEVVKGGSAAHGLSLDNR